MNLAPFLRSWKAALQGHTKVLETARLLSGLCIAIETQVIDCAQARALPSYPVEHIARATVVCALQQSEKIEYSTCCNRTVANAKHRLHLPQLGRGNSYIDGRQEDTAFVKQVKDREDLDTLVLLTYPCYEKRNAEEEAANTLECWSY